MKRERIPTIWYKVVTLNKRKSCIHCHAPLHNTAIISVGEYISGKYRRIFYACSQCITLQLQNNLLVNTFKVSVCSTYSRVPWVDALLQNGVYTCE